MNNEDIINPIEEPSKQSETVKEEVKNGENKDSKASETVKDDVATSAEGEGPTLQEVIEKQATEEESPFASHFTLKKILGGDVLTTQTIRHQIGVFLLITAFLIVYIANRYSVQNDLIEIDRLQNELQDAKYKALSSSSQLTEKSRESHVLELLKNNKDSVLKIASQPPYIINVPEE